jgi:hypothetical protein
MSININSRISALEAAVNPGGGSCVTCRDRPKAEVQFEKIDPDVPDNGRVDQERKIHCPECGAFWFVLRIIRLDGEKRILNPGSTGMDIEL